MESPYEIYQRVLRMLSAERLPLVLRDQELIRDGWTIHFAIDPYDISEFCFPFRPGDFISQFTMSKIDEVSRLQNGRYEAFYNLSTRPVLLDPYVEEMESIQEWANWSNYVRSDVDLLDEYLNQLRIPQRGNQREEAKTALVELTEKHITSVIAVVSGIASIGAKRLTDVMNRRLTRGYVENNHHGGPDLYERSEVIEKICGVFEKYFEGAMRSEARGQGERLLQRSRHLIEVNNMRDAKAVDQLLQLNEHYRGQRRLFLYLSSASKSLGLYRAPELHSYLPEVDGSPYDFVRTAGDLFVYMIYRGESGDRKEQAAYAIEQLESVQKVIEKIEQIRNRFRAVSERCLHCSGQVSEPLCEHGELCEGVRQVGEFISRRQEEHVDLSLQRRLATILDKSKDLPRTGKHSYILEMLSQILSEIEPVVARDQQMDAILEGLLARAYFVSTLVTAPKQSERGIRVSCDLNYYPVRLAIKNNELKQIMKRVLLLLPLHRWSLEEFQKYVAEYLKLDVRFDEEPETELMRCFLYIIMQENEKAKYVSQKFLETGRETDPKIIQEFRYLHCFVLWRSADFEKAIDQSNLGTDYDKKDGRFYHCRSMIMYSMLRRRGEHQNYNWSSVVNNASNALQRFRRSWDKQMQAVCYNNLAYFHSWYDLGMVDVGKAEKYLTELQKRIPEEGWKDYPEFFHTKGCVLYARFLESEDKQNLSVLDNAYQAAIKALELYPDKPEHKELKEAIERKKNQLLSDKCS